MIFQSTNKQALFDLAYNGVIGQGHASHDGQGNSRYINDYGYRCSVGHCMTDDGIGIARALERRHDTSTCIAKIMGMEVVKKFSTGAYDLLHDIQHAHDTATVQHWDDDTFLQAFTTRMKGVANKHNLSIPE